MANQYTTGRVKGDPRWAGDNGKYDNRVYMAEYLQRPEIKEHRRKYIQERHLEFQKWLAQIQALSGCLRCGERDPRCLQFHHRDSQTKKYNVTAMSGRSQDVVLKEMDKCDVLCANCHYKLHAASWMNDIDWAASIR